MKNKLIAISATALPFIFISTSTPLHAENFLAVNDAVRVNADGGLELSITANRRVKSLDKTLASVSVITRNDIEKTQAQDIVDILRLQQGISLARTGGSGNNTSVFIRGSESDQVLVLLDGVRVSSATIGSFNWASLPINQVERIEIVRGPRAALYGSDAIGGVIEITTRKKAGAYVSITAGKYNTKGVSAGISGGDKTHFSLGFSTEKSDGFSAKSKNAGSSYNPDKDPYHRDSINLTASHQVNDKVKVGAQLFGSKNNADYDQGNSKSNLQTLSGYVNADINEQWSQKLSVSKTTNNTESKSSFGVSNFDTLRKEFNWQNNVNLNDSTSLILGTNYRQDTGISKNYDKKITNKAVYANLNKRFNTLNLDTSLRYDKHSKVGGKTTGQIALGYQFGKIAPYISYGTAFKAPTINELYYPGFSGSYAGNANLTPETSKTYEIGIKSQLTQNQRLEASIFQTKVDNLISFSGIKNQAINTDKATMKGLEIGYTGESHRIDWGVGLSLLRTKDKTTDERLLRRPDSKVNLKLGYTIANKTRLGFDASLVSSRDDMDYSPAYPAPAVRTKLNKYTLLNLSLSHKVNKHFNLGLRLDNATNEKYQLAHGYNTPERGAYFTLGFK